MSIGGPLSQGFMRFLGDVNELPCTPASRGALISELRRAYFGGAAFLIAMIEEASSNEEAAQLMLIIKAEAEAMSDELNAANDRYCSDDPPPGTPAA